MFYNEQPQNTAFSVAKCTNASSTGLQVTSIVTLAIHPNRSSGGHSNDLFLAAHQQFQDALGSHSP